MSSTDSTNALTTGNNLAGANDPRPKPHVDEWEAQRDAAEAVCLQISSRPVKYDQRDPRGPRSVPKPDRPSQHRISSLARLVSPG